MGSPPFQVCCRVLHTSFRIFNTGPEVRDYVEGMQKSDLLLDLLSATGSDELEPTRTVAERTALYTDVRQTLIFYLVKLTFLAVSSYVYPSGWC